MDKTMRSLLALLALAGCVHAQTYKTVTADTNNVIRTNFSLVRSQVSDLSGANFAISNITGLQTSLDGKLATNGSAVALTNFPAFLLQTNGSAGSLTNFPTIVLQTNSSLSAFPVGLLRTNGDGSALTNLPNANLSNAIGVLPISNGGTGSTNQSSARTALGLGSAATNDASAFQPASTALTNLAAGDASGLTNLPNANLGTATGVLGIANGGSAATNAEGARTNFGLVWSGLTNTDAAGFRTALSLGTAATNDAFAFQPASANLTNLAANNGGSLTNVSVDLTAVLPAYSNNAGKVLAVATGATNVEWTAISNTVTDASTLTNFPALILQTNSAETNFPAFLLRTNGNASGLTFPASLLTTNGNGAALTNLTAANITGTVALATNVSGTVAVANGGTGGTTASNARVNLLPSYSGNASRVLALNSNASDVVWAVDGGGQANLTNVTNTLGLFHGGTGATNASTALENLSIIQSGGAIILNGTRTADWQVALGGAPSGFGSIAIGYQTRGDMVAIGQYVTATNGSVGIGLGDNTDRVTASGVNSVAIGAYSVAQGLGSIALGRVAKTGTGNSSVQIAEGLNTNAETIQFLSAGSVNTTEWGYLANASTRGGYVMTNTAAISTNRTFVSYDGTNYVTNSVTISNGIITGWTQ